MVFRIGAAVESELLWFDTDERRPGVIEPVGT